jgi:hypothetical protein
MSKSFLLNLEPEKLKGGNVRCSEGSAMNFTFADLIEFHDSDGQLFRLKVILLQKLLISAPITSSNSNRSVLADRFFFHHPIRSLHT